jgi:hypothetical protein
MISRHAAGSALMLLLGTSIGASGAQPGGRKEITVPGSSRSSCAGTRAAETAAVRGGYARRSTAPRAER